MGDILELGGRRMPGSDDGVRIVNAPAGLRPVIGENQTYSVAGISMTLRGKVFLSLKKCEKLY